MNMTTQHREEVRRQFEAWAKAHGMSVNTYKSIPYYLEDGTQLAWDAYQAALSSPAVAGLVDVLHELQESAAYWSDYDVPIGIVDRINSALAQYATLAGESHD